MRRHCQYLVTIDTIYPDRYEREEKAYVIGDMLPPAPMPVRTGWIAGLIDRLVNWQARRASRRALLDMRDDQLRDIGVNRIAANHEAGRSRFL